MVSDNQIKKDSIVDAAIKRFSHFGIAKTSLTEIADDLLLTKQALAYYFPDKQSIIQAAEKRITAEYIDTLNRHLNNTPSFRKVLDALISIKNSYFRKYYILANEVENMEQAASASLPRWKEALMIKESGLLVPHIIAGIARGELKQTDAAKTSVLVLETLYALTRCVHMNGGLPDETELKKTLENQHDAVRLFYEGLKSATWKN